LLAGLTILASNDGKRATATTTYSFGIENSWIRIQNIGDADANVQLDYYDANGALAGTDSCPSATCPPMYPGSGWTFFQGENATLPQGFAGSSVISTDQPIVAVLAKDVRRNGVFSISGDTLEMGSGGHRLYLPSISKYAGPGQDWNGRFVVQNMSDRVTACVTITYLSHATDTEVAWEPYNPAGAPSSDVYAECPNGGMPLLPRGSILKHPDNMAPATPFAGAVRIDLHTNKAGLTPDKQFVFATADTWNLNAAGFGSYRAFTEADLGREFILPLIDREVGPSNSYSTRFHIVNRDPGRPAAVHLEFRGYDVDGETPDIEIMKTSTFTVHGSRSCEQDGETETNCLAAGDALPAGFVGTVRLLSTEPIAVVVDRDTWINDYFTDYRGVRPEDTGTQVLLPVLNKNYGPQNGIGVGWNSWFRVMVADGGTANVTVTYYGLDIPGGSTSYTVPVHREFTVFQFNEALPDGFAGTAIISADRPIVAIANIYTDSFSGDTDVLYNGVALD
jgi:hypothetical protein